MLQDHAAEEWAEGGVVELAPPAHHRVALAAYLLELGEHRRDRGRLVEVVELRGEVLALHPVRHPPDLLIVIAAHVAAQATVMAKPEGRGDITVHQRCPRELTSERDGN